MKLAWFAPASPDGAALDDLSHVRDALSAAHDIHVVRTSDAHDFVWQQARTPYDLTVFELADTPAHHYLWAYLLTYPGVVVLRATSLHTTRAFELLHRGRRAAYDVELTFNEGVRRAVVPWHVSLGRWPFVRMPSLAARMVVVGDAAAAADLQRRVPEAHVRHAPLGIHPPPEGASSPRSESRAAGRRMRVVDVDGQSTDVLRRAVARAQRAGAEVEQVSADAGTAAYSSADVVVALGRPAFPTGVVRALAGLAAARCVIVPETADTAGWPAIDPQSWSPRGHERLAAPVVVSIDPRDEEHSLSLALRRLAADEGLRTRLAADGYRWWLTHGTPAHAAAAWDELLREAAALAPPSRPPDWPAHLSEDGGGLARRVLADVGLTADWL